VPTLLGNLFGVSTTGPARAAAFLHLSPLFSAALSILWLDEQLACAMSAASLRFLQGTW
jgi:drug/metabolite transporter (DMT)-like permease